MRTTRPPYSREKKNKYAVGREWAGASNACGALNRFVRKKSKLVCNWTVAAYYWDTSLEACCCLLYGLLGRKTQAGRTPQPIADGVGKQNVLYQAFMVAVELRTSSLSL